MSHLIPVRRDARDVFSGSAALLVATPLQSHARSQDLLHALFDLTPAEARLAALVGSGLAPRDAAVKLGVTEETARTTLKRVFAKVGVSRQSQLAVLLSRIILPQRPS